MNLNGGRDYKLKAIDKIQDELVVYNLQKRCSLEPTTFKDEDEVAFLH